MLVEALYPVRDLTFILSSMALWYISKLRTPVGVIQQRSRESQAISRTKCTVFLLLSRSAIEKYE